MTFPMASITTRLLAGFFASERGTRVPDINEHMVRFIIAKRLSLMQHLAILERHHTGSYKVKFLKAQIADLEQVLRLEADRIINSKG